MKKLRKLMKGLAMLLSLAMVAGLMPGMGSVQVSAEEVTGGSVAAGGEETAAGYDANGFCTSYVLTDGNWALINGAECTSHTGCNGYQPATLTTGDYDLDGDNNTNDQVYEISNAGQLYWFAALVNDGNANANANAVLTNDITVNESILTEDGKLREDLTNPRSWIPIGNDKVKYQGTFDGQSHIIKGLYTNNQESGYIGLFGNVYENGCVSNVTVNDSYFCGNRLVGGICGKFYNGSTNNKGTINNCINNSCVVGTSDVGGVCGNSEYGTIEGCSNSGSVTGSSSNIGGVCGYTGYNNTIKNCHNTGSVTSTSCVGGVCGSNNNGEIMSSSSTGTITGSDNNIGGVCGYNYIGKIKDCYSTGTVAGSNTKSSTSMYVGGVCGNNLYQGTIESCYSTGTVTGTRNVGGVCGHNEDSGTIKYCYSTGSITASYLVGGVCGYNDGSAITNCYNTGTVAGVKVGSNTSANFGGVCGYNTGNGTVESCFSAGSVKGSSNVGGVCGTNNNGGTITNCYYDSKLYNGNAIGNDASGSDTSGCSKTTAQFKSGQVAYLLNNSTSENSIWGQDLGIATYPVLGGRTVYKVQANFCDNTNGDAYSNENKNPEESMHKGYDNGICSCGAYEEARINEDVYEISNAGQLYWFAGLVNGTLEGVAANPAAKAKLMDNIDLGYESDWTPIGSKAKPFTGSFDGNGKTISGLKYTGQESEYLGLFGYSDGSITRLGVVYSDFENGQYVGSVCGYNNSGSITNCYSMVGYVIGSNVGGVCGYNNSGSITNCCSIGDYTDTEENYSVVAVCGHNSGTITNCYYEGDEDAGESKTTEQFNSGEVTYLLQGNQEETIWGQDLSDANSYPGLDAAYKVYQVDMIDCSTGEAGQKGYSNSNANISKHYFDEDGFCTGNDAYQPAVYNDSNKAYEISNAGQLYWFAEQVNSGDTSINATLMNDIIVNSNVLDADGKLNEADKSSFRSWTPIGIDNNNCFKGNFIGNGYKISGLYYSGSDAARMGLFGTLSGQIIGVGVVDTYFNAGYVGGVCCLNQGFIYNCYNTGTVTGSANVGGICADNMSIIINCYNTGTVTGTGLANVGGICSANKGGGIINCYNTGTVTGTESATVGSICAIGGANISSCYYLGDDETDSFDGTTAEELEQFTSGEVAYLLSKAGNFGVCWGQKLGKSGDAYPVLNLTGDESIVVYQNINYSGCSESEPGTASYSYSNTNREPVYAHNDQDGDGICETCGAYVDGIGARLAGHSLTLDGSVGVNFYMELSEAVIADDAAYMEFTLPGGKTATVKVKEALAEEISGKTYYKFRCQVNAAEMTDIIQAQLISTAGSSKVYEYTVKEYADYLFEHKEGNEGFTKAAALIEAMVNYGSYAQIYAGYNADKLAVGESSKLKPVTDVTLDASKYTYTPNANETKVQFAGANLSLLSTTTLRMYFRIKDVAADSVTFTYKGNELAKTQSGDYYYVELAGIPASDLDGNFVVTVNDGTNTFDVTYTPMAYCANVVNRAITETRTEALKNLIKALVLYNRAADAYINQQG